METLFKSILEKLNIDNEMVTKVVEIFASLSNDAKGIVTIIAVLLSTMKVASKPKTDKPYVWDKFKMLENGGIPTVTMKNGNTAYILQFKAVANGGEIQSYEQVAKVGFVDGVFGTEELKDGYLGYIKWDKNAKNSLLSKCYVFGNEASAKRFLEQGKAYGEWYRANNDKTDDKKEESVKDLF